MKITYIILISALILSACHQKHADSSSSTLYNLEIDEEMIPMDVEYDMIPSEPHDSYIPEKALAENKEVIKKKIIKDGRIGIEVSILEKAKAEIDSIIQKLDGYYANEKLETWSTEIKYNLKIRIPNNKFEILISSIDNGNGKILYKEIDARDVTDQFIDLETRLANKINYLKRYNELLIKAKTVKDILEIQEKIRRIEEEIESTTGRLKYLNDQVNYSTLDLTISQPKDFKYQTPKRDSFTKRLKHSVKKGWFGFIDFVILMVKIWPFWILAILIVYGWRKFKKTRRNK